MHHHVTNPPTYEALDDSGLWWKSPCINIFVVKWWGEKKEKNSNTNNVKAHGLRSFCLKYFSDASIRAEKNWSTSFGAFR